MRQALRLRNPIMPYAWGSRRAIRALRGLEGPSSTPEAELWMGAHEKAPSEVWIDGRWTSLAGLIAARPRTILGAAVVDRFGTALPFLMKILAAAEPLSIQAHPNAAQAVAGCLREDALGIPREAPTRNYRDQGHKPELIVALEPFTIMRGFRSPDEIAARLSRLGLAQHLNATSDLGKGSDRGLRALLTEVIALDAERTTPIVAQALRARDDDDLADRWMARLVEAYPGDSGALSPIWLEVTTLAPGDAVFTGPGILHAYLDGTGVEIMANSDNVLRGGLTPKHVDCDELLSVLDFAATGDGRITPRVDGCTRTWSVPASEFELVRVDLGPEAITRDVGASLELVFVAGGFAVIETAESSHPVSRGDAFLVPASAASYTLAGDGYAFIARAGA